MLTYSKEELQAGMNHLVGKRISEIYYVNKHELFQSFTQLAGKVECVLLGGVIIKTSDNVWFHISDIEYFPLLQLGGIKVEKSATEMPVGDRKNHMGDPTWLKYTGHEIAACEAHDITYMSAGNEYVAPLGVSLKFTDGSSLHVYNAFVEDYDAQSKKYELSVGESLTFFYDDESLKNYPELEHGQVVVVDQDFQD